MFILRGSDLCAAAVLGRARCRQEPESYDVTTLGDCMTENSKKHGKTPLEEAETYLVERSALTNTNANYPLPLALFAAMTHCWEECFDVVPYLGFTATTKRTGKSNTTKLESFLSLRPLFTASITKAALFRTIDAIKPTLAFDEAEEEFSKLRSEFRAILNNGYKKGGCVIRAQGKATVSYDVCCPKLYNMIGDPYETLRDRSILVVMTRGEAHIEFSEAEAKPTGERIAAHLHALILDHKNEIEKTYLNYTQHHNPLRFLNARDREIWKPLFAICQVLMPTRLTELEQTAVDICTLKTRTARRFTQLRDEETKADALEYGERLLRDMAIAMKDLRQITTSELIRELRSFRTSPWRTYAGTGITEDKAGAMLLAGLIAPFSVFPKTIRVKLDGQPHSTAKGYVTAEVIRAVKELNPPKVVTS